MGKIICMDRFNPLVGDSNIQLRKDCSQKKTTAEDFDNAIKDHLTDYKMNKLHVSNMGTWRGIEKSHILTKESEELNLMGFTKSDVDRNSSIKFHIGFAHLNSSQAMCMNFFYPLMKNSKLDIISKILKINGQVTDAQFEKESNIETENYRKTNFDYYCKINDINIYFEIKYSEQEFGGALRDTDHKNKYKAIYKNHCFNNPVFISDIDEETFLDNYQIMRNFIVLDHNSYVVFVYPKENIRVRKQILDAKNIFISDKFYNQVILLTWENLLDFILSDNTLGSDHSLVNHYIEFKEKYLSY